MIYWFRLVFLKKFYNNYIIHSKMMIIFVIAKFCVEKI